jgi:hypothetical protein
MGTKLTNYTLPEWVFLDANSHSGNPLEDRTVIQHIRSYTIIEVIALDEIVLMEMKTKPFNFEYTNLIGVIEKHAMFVHFSLAEFSDLDSIVQRAINWYCDYLRWEDENIQNDNLTIEN